MTTQTARELFERGFGTHEIAVMLKRTEFEVYNELGRLQGSIDPPKAVTYEERKAYMRKYYRTVTRPKILAKRASA
ncbi:hypothetical protein [Rhizobium phage RHEph18]|uniref:hypothetical protein n=1 Tax=Rhizobium TaxID=379 RepID=UPI0007E9399B|nr:MULTISPECIES: hypothetical protein [Rhizobium]ANL02673.1 hypothetical protein AMJ99_CH01086 [Rhizobium esperanzae]ANM33525.1 hypothetical protein AMK04_CH01087 [Rhizobium sp. N871]QIG73758.1 hypothetical protein EVC05_066 [Rhizobium phage RHph_N2]QXV74476.1 hypothetical protein [Rhizobium phage RHEph18]